MSPPAVIVGVNDDRFTLKQSSADCNYLYTAPHGKPFVDTVIKIVRRERVNVVIATDDHLVKDLSDARGRFPIKLFLPRRETIDLCQDKFALSEFFRSKGIRAPRTYAVRSLRGLEAIFARFRRGSVLWCRARRGSRSLGAAPVLTVEQARAWITLWRDLHGVSVSDFTLAEYLPGRHWVVPSVWHKGTLLRVQATEILGYFAAGNNPSRVSSLASLAKTVVAEAALGTALNAVRALERRPHGAFCVELKDTADGVPAITEINIGRFPAGITELLAIGKDNMVELFASAATGKPKIAAEPLGSAIEYYLVRDLDAEPGIVAADSLFEKIGQARSSSGGNAAREGQFTKL
jgi:carbamoyl-phosphate synthase large subunit